MTIHRKYPHSTGCGRFISLICAGSKGMYYNIIHQCLKKNNKKRKYWTRKKIHLINDAFSFKINAKNWILFTTRDLNYRGNRMSSLRIIYTYDISQTQIRVHIIYSGRIYFMCSYKPLLIPIFWISRSIAIKSFELRHLDNKCGIDW